MVMKNFSNFLNEDFMDVNDHLFMGYYQGMTYENAFEELLNAVNIDDSGNYNTIKSGARLAFAFTEKKGSDKSAFVIKHSSSYYVFENYCGSKRTFKTIDTSQPMEKLSVLRSVLVSFYDDNDLVSSEKNNKMVKKFDRFFGIKSYIRKFDPIVDPYGEENWEEDD
jgi:hypothetical protein